MNSHGAGEMAPQLREPAVLPGEQGYVPGTHMAS